MEIKEAKKERNSSDKWYYEILTHRGNKKYMFLRIDGMTFYLSQDDLAVSKKYQIGFICRGLVYAYDMKNKKILWIKEFKSLWGSSVIIKMRIDEEKRTLMFNFKDKFKENCLLEIDFKGDVIRDTRSKSVYQTITKDFNDETFVIVPEIVSVKMTDIDKLMYEDHGIYAKYKSKNKVEDLALQHYRNSGFEGFHFDGAIGYTISHALELHLFDAEVRNGFDCFGHEANDNKAIAAFKILAKCFKKKAKLFRKIMQLTGGKPDLFIYKKELSDFFFVEVKGVNDSLSDVQKLWFTYLVKTNLAKVKLVYLLIENDDTTQVPKSIEWNLSSLVNSLEDKEKKQMRLLEEEISELENKKK